MGRSKRWALAGAGVLGAGVLPALVGVGVAGAGVAGAATRSTRMAGYEATGRFTTLETTVVVPTLTCKSTGTFSTDLSTQLYGAAGGGSFVRLRCVNGTASYTGTVGWATGGSKVFAVAPGDTIQTSLAVKPSGTKMVAIAKVTDETTGIVTRRAYTLKPGTETAAYVIVQDVGGAAIPAFSPVTWSNVTIDGATLASSAPTEYVLVDSSNKTLVKTSAIATTGERFTNTFAASR